MEKLSLKKNSAAFMIACVMLASVSTSTQAARRRRPTRRQVTKTVLPIGPTLLRTAVQRAYPNIKNIPGDLSVGMLMVVAKSVDTGAELSHTVACLGLLINILEKRLANERTLQADWAGNSKQYTKLGMHTYAQFREVIAEAVLVLKTNLHTPLRSKKNKLEAIPVKKKFEQALKNSKNIPTKLTKYMTEPNSRWVVFKATVSRTLG